MTVAQFMDYLRGFPPSAEVVIPNGDPTSDDYLVAKPHAPEEVPVARFGVIKAVVVGMEFGRVPTLRVCNPDSRRKLKRSKNGELTASMAVAQ